MKRAILSTVLLCGTFFCTTSISAQTMDSTATYMLNGWVTKYNLTPTVSNQIKPYILSEETAVNNLKKNKPSKSNTALINAKEKAYGDTIKGILVQDGVNTNLKKLSYKYKFTESSKKAVSPVLLQEITSLQNIDTLNISQSQKDSLNYAVQMGFDNQVSSILESEMEWNLSKKLGLTSKLDSTTTTKALYNYNLQLIQTQNKLGTDPTNTTLLNTLLDMMIDPPALLSKLIVSVRTAQNGNKGKYTW